MRIYTVGHSNRTLEELLDLLDEHRIGLVADIRRYPGSRKFPHFNREPLSQSLAERGIGYRWFEALGGRRHGEVDPGSPNRGLRSPGFRNYADYMATAPFGEAVDELLSLAGGQLGTDRPGTAIMCAEKLFWRCHRRLVSDFLTARGVEVMHILDSGGTRAHALSKDARVTKAGGVVYPG